MKGAIASENQNKASPEPQKKHLFNYSLRQCRWGLKIPFVAIGRVKRRDKQSSRTCALLMKCRKSNQLQFALIGLPGRI